MKNLVLITSVIKTPNLPLSYTNSRSIYSHEERFEQTKKTFETVRERIPNCEIILVECSDLSKEQNEYFAKNSDYYINLVDNPEIIKNVHGISKSLGEGTMTICALDFIIKNNIEYDNLIKVSGRYWLSENFNYNNFENEDIIIKYIDNNVNNVFTALYKLPNRHVKEYADFLIQNIDKMIKCIGFEVLFSIFLKTMESTNKTKIVNINPIGLAGNVSVSNDFYNG
jgi:hypothetical protein